MTGIRILAVSLLAAALPLTAATFNFESVPVSAITPLSDTQGGITATFTSGTAEEFFVVTGGIFVTLNGNVLLDSGPLGPILNVSFSQVVNDVALLFALNSTTPGAASFTIQAFLGNTSVCSNTYSPGIPIGGLIQEGAANCSSAGGIDNIRLTSTAPDFAVDNLDIRSGGSPIPEPGTVVLLVSGLGLMVAGRRRG